MFKILLCSLTALLFYGSHASASIVNIKEKVAARVQETQNEKKIYPITYFLDKLRQSHNLNHFWAPTPVPTELPQEVTEILHHTSYYYPTYLEVPRNRPVHHYPKSVDKPSAYRMFQSYETAPSNSLKLSYSYSVQAGRHKVKESKKLDAVPRPKVASGRKASSHRASSAKISRKTTTIAPLRNKTTAKPRTTTSPPRTETTTTRRSPKQTTTTMAPTRVTKTTPHIKRITTTTTTKRPKTTTTTTKRPKTTTATTTTTKRTTAEPTTTRRTIKLKPLSHDQEAMMKKIRDVIELKNLENKFRHSYHVKYTERHNSSKKANTTQPDVASPHHYHNSPLFKITKDPAINNNYVWEMNQMMNKIQSRYNKYDPQINEVIRGAASILSIYGATKPEKSEIIDMNEYPPVAPTINYSRPGVPATLQQIYRYPLVVNKTSAIDF